MAGEPPQRASAGDVPEEDLAIAADGCKPGIVIGDGDVEDFIAVRRIGLDEAGLGLVRLGFGGIIEMDGTVGGAGEDLGWGK